MKKRTFASQAIRMAVVLAMLPLGIAWAQDTTVRIGSVTAASGPMAGAGLESHGGARLAVETLNARGVTIGGRKVTFELLAEDDAADPARAPGAAAQLVDAKVVAVVGHFTSGTTAAAVKTYADAGIPLLVPSATNPRITRSGSKTVFRIIADDTRVGAALGRRAASTLGLRRVFVVDDGSAYGQGVAGEFEAAYRAAGGEIAARRTVPPGGEPAPLVDAVKAANADALFFGGFNMQGGPLVGALAQGGFDGPVLGGDGLCTPDLATWAGGTLKDDRVVCALPGGVERQTNPMAVKFQADFSQRFSRESQFYAPFAYDAVMVLADAMVRAGSVDPAAFVPALAATSGYAGVTGTIAFDAKGDVVEPAVTMVTYRGGRRTPTGVVR